MAYQALYRKWRPATFNDVIGQSHIINTLKNQITEGKIAHAYLFTGTRGTGKTSTAKIFSKAVNCISNNDGNPCNQCEVCNSIADGSNIDIIEIDAASNNGVANIRDIIEQCRYSCAVSKYKIYIIDEVHMLSKGAFNALLKTLEEPPEHVIFILATTEIHMVPATILSRCQRFDFSVISMYDITGAMQRILADEGIEVDNDALEYIAYLGNGSMRDSLSILDRCIACKPNGITYEDIVSVVGAIDDTVLYKMASYISAGDTAKLISEFDECIKQGKSLDNFAADLLNVYRELLNYSILNSQYECSVKKRELINNTIGNYSTEKLISCIYAVSELVRDLRFVSNKRVLIECSLIKLANPRLGSDTNNLLDRIAAIEKQLASGSITVRSKIVENDDVVCDETTDDSDDSLEQIITDDYPDIQAANTQQITNDTAQKPENEQLGGYSKIINMWAEILEELQNQKHIILYFHISQAIPTAIKDGVLLQFPDIQSKQTFDAAKESDILAGVILVTTGLDAVVKTCVIGDEAPVEEISANSGDLFSELAKHSGQFPDNISLD